MHSLVFRRVLPSCRPATHHPLQTTLMDVLAGRKTVGTITGDIRLNGKEPPAFHSVYRHPMLARLGGEGKTASARQGKEWPTCTCPTRVSSTCRLPQAACHFRTRVRLLRADGCGAARGLWQRRAALSGWLGTSCALRYGTMPWPHLPTLPQTTTHPLPPCTSLCSSGGAEGLRVWAAARAGACKTQPANSLTHCSLCSARLRLPKSTPADIVEEFVQEVCVLWGC